MNTKRTMRLDSGANSNVLLKEHPIHASLVEYFSTPIKSPNVTTKAGVDLGEKSPKNEVVSRACGVGFGRKWGWV